MANRLGAMRGPGASYSDVILRIATMERPLMSWESPPASTEAERHAFAFAEEVRELAVGIVDAAIAKSSSKTTQTPSFMASRSFVGRSPTFKAR